MLDYTKVHWFPLRVCHSTPKRLMTMQELLEKETLVEDTYIPMEYRTANAHTVLAPAINNILFVRSSYQSLREIRKSQYLYEPLRYIMHPVSDGKESRSEVLYVPQGMMQDFIRVTKERADNVIFLDNIDFACKPGMKVRITEGFYAGVTGVVKRIKKNLCVVLTIRGVAAAAIMYVPRHHLCYISDAEYEAEKQREA